MFKIALTAGHYKYTSGKRCLKTLDKNETREWVLNDRIADKVQKMLSDFEGYDLIRTDDTTGEKAIELNERIKKANNFKADVYISVHHNAGIGGGKGGGIVAYTYTKVEKETEALQKELYDALIKYTGLKGNRAQPLAKANLAECRDTAMPAVLLELGFMDSSTDVPVILSEDYADKCAKAIVEVLVKKGNLVKKEKPGKTLYRVQVGAFSKKENAENLAAELKKKGYDAIIKKDGD
ncbi:MAG: N-acetylmuramoyl-L-alanine amidase [Ruminococcaceae bacterium]|nr:N-acetylmuramoyl-L-alanine amidase [Oscillospiraceae bacterium]